MKVVTFYTHPKQKAELKSETDTTDQPREPRPRPLPSFGGNKTKDLGPGFNTVLLGGFL